MGALLPQAKLSKLNTNQAILLPKWRAALSKVMSGTADAKILCIGDSTTFGTGSNGSSTGNLVDKAYPAFLSKYLNAYLAGFSAYAENESWLGTGPLGTSQAAFNPRITAGGSWSQNASSLGGRLLRASTTTNALSFLPTINVDKFDIYYLQRNYASVFSWDINGGSATNIDAQNAGQNLAKATITTSLASNTLNLKYVSGTDVYVLGVNGYNSASKRVAVMNAGWGTSKASDWSGIISLYSALTTVAANLVILNLGINDWLTAVSVSTYQTNMQAIITALVAAGSDVLLVTPAPSNEGYLSAPAPSVQQSYVNAMLALAASNNLPIIDFYGRLVSYSVSNGNGLYSDGVHPIGAAYADQARTIFNAITI